VLIFLLHYTLYSFTYHVLAGHYFIYMDKIFGRCAQQPRKLHGPTFQPKAELASLIWMHLDVDAIICVVLRQLDPVRLLCSLVTPEEYEASLAKPGRAIEAA